jgi:hypothetical protein
MTLKGSECIQQETIVQAEMMKTIWREEKRIRGSKEGLIYDQAGAGC